MNFLQACLLAAMTLATAFIFKVLITLVLAHRKKTDRSRWFTLAPWFPVPAALVAAVFILLNSGFESATLTAENEEISEAFSQGLVTLQPGSTLRIDEEKKQAVLDYGVVAFDTSGASGGCETDTPWAYLAGDVSLCTLGTRFEIKYRPPSLQIAVMDGAVQVTGSMNCILTVNEGGHVELTNGKKKETCAIWNVYGATMKCNPEGTECETPCSDCSPPSPDTDGDGDGDGDGDEPPVPLLRKDGEECSDSKECLSGVCETTKCIITDTTDLEKNEPPELRFRLSKCAKPSVRVGELPKELKNENVLYNKKGEIIAYEYDVLADDSAGTYSITVHFESLAKYCGAQK